MSADARVWTLNALVFKRTVIAAMRKRVMERVSWLSGVKILKALSAPDLQRIATVMKAHTCVWVLADAVRRCVR